MSFRSTHTYFIFLAGIHAVSRAVTTMNDYIVLASRETEKGDININEELPGAWRQTFYCIFYKSHLGSKTVLFNLRDRSIHQG